MAKAKAEKAAHRVNTHKANGSASSSTEVAPPGRRGRPRNVDLPGLEDRAIKPLEDLAAAYADVRDRRIELNREEVELKTRALKLMHKYEKTVYKRNGIEIRIVPGDEAIKVKVAKGADPDADVAIASPAARDDQPGA